MERGRGSVLLQARAPRLVHREDAEAKTQILPQCPILRRLLTRWCQLPWP